MPLRYRVMIVALGVFVLFGGGLSLFSVPRLDPATGPRVRAVLGALVAIAVGISLTAAGYRGRAPAWLRNLIVGGRDSE